MGSGSTTIATKHSTDQLSNGDKNNVSNQAIRAALGGVKNTSIKRFSQIHTIGLGGIGTVLSAYEKHLDRNLAIKMLRPAFRDNRDSINRFIQEARATAHIAHPNIVPVYELGIFEDTGPFFTMKRVEGVTLQHVLQRLNEGDDTYVKKYTLRNLLNIFISTCHGVAYAHSQNIIHRDLKPSNIMLGDYGEVMVMDWGLAKRAKPAQGRTLQTPAPVSVDEQDITKTLDGEVTGTPAFMSPEQACGDNSAVDMQSDIYSLGAMLYVMLTKQRSPFPSGLNTQEILQLNAESKFISPRKRMPKLKIPPELNAITMKAMSREKEQRYATVLDLIHDIRCYLDHYPVNAYPEPLYITFFKACRRRPLIPTTVVTAITALIIAFGFQIYNKNERFNFYIKQANENIRAGDMMYARSKSVIKRLTELRQSGETNDEKFDALNKQLNMFSAALNNYYNVAEGFLEKIEATGSRSAEAESRLGYIMKNRIYYSLLSEDYQTTKRLIELMRLNKRPQSYLQVSQNKTLYRKMNLVFYDEGIINLESTPVTCQIRIKELHDKKSGLKYLEDKLLGLTPIKQLTVSAGSYLLTVYNIKNKTTIKVPLQVEAGDIIHEKIYVPDHIPEGMTYIPAGAYYAGTASASHKMQKKYLPGFFIKTAEVTFGEYLRFWLTLTDSVKKQNYRAMLLLNKNSRRLAPAWDNSAKLYFRLKPEYPVCGISHAAAEAYCRWISIQRHYPCRLPTADQWEKAARGVDGRKYLWGCHIKPKSILIPENQTAIKKYPFGAPAATFPLDTSIYGIHDMGGNVREYTCTLNHGSHNMFIVKGGSSRIGGSSLVCSFNGFAGRLADDIGFRYIMPLTRAIQQKSNKQKGNAADMK